MKAFVLTDLLQMEMREVPDPKITAPDDVLIRIRSVGVCGSDVHYYKTGRIGSQVVQYPFAVGHECAGIVEAVGRGVKNLRPGDRVAIDPAMPCGECDQCRAGRAHTCRKMRFLGCPGQAEGSLSEYIVMPEGSLFRIDDAMTLDEAALSEPLSIGVYALKLAGGVAGKRVGVLGFGPIGMSVLLPAQCQSPESVFVTDKLDARLERARACGVTWAGNVTHEDAARAILEREPRGLDLVFECCGEQDALDQAIEVLRPGGKLMIIGIPEVPRISFEIDKLRRKEIAIQNVRRQNECVAPALELIESKCVDVNKMLSHRFPFEKTKEAFDMVMNYRDGVMKAVIEV